MKSTRTAVMIALSLVSFAGAAKAQIIYGVFGSGSSEHLISFDSANPGLLTENVTMSGLAASDTVFNIAFQPSTGELWGLGSQRLYTIDTATGAATQVGGTLSSLFGGSQVGFNFDPVTGLIHVVTNNTGANLTIDPSTQVITTGTAVAFGAGDVHQGSTPSISALAFSNNFSGASSTTMYDLNIASEVATLATQNEGTGVLSTVGSGAGSFGGTPASLAISSSGAAFAALQLNLADPGNTRLYSVNLATGGLTLVDIIGGENFLNVESIAIPVSAVPEPGSLVMMGLGVVGLMLRRRREARA